MASNGYSVAFLMADYGHDPTETAIPFQTFKQAGFQCSFITEHGKIPECDSRMLKGWTGRLLGAGKSAVKAYHEMEKEPEWQNPLSWSDEKTSLKDFDLLFLPGGHDAKTRQLLDSERAQQLVAEFWSSVKKPGNKCCAAICHGVQLLAHTKVEGTSVIHDVETTALTGSLENVAFWGTRLFLGDYYKTYGAGTANVEDVVKNSLDDPTKQWKSSANAGTPFVVADENHNYLSGRWPGDAKLLADKTVSMVQTVRQATQAPS